MPTIKRILCPVDFSDIAAVGAREAATLARASGAELVLVHALSEPWLANSDASGYGASIAQQYAMIARCKLEAARDALDERTRASVALVYGPVADAVALAAVKLSADVIVMGGRRRKGVAKLLADGMTGRVMDRARVPVVRVCPPSPRKPPMRFASPHGVA